MSDPSSVIAISIQPAAPETWVEFGIMPQLAEAMSREDEWTGTKDAAARKRKAPIKKTDELGASPETRVGSEDLMQCWDDEQQAVSAVPASRMMQLHRTRRPLLPPWSSVNKK
ncbi:hypothetical protein CPAR01_11673 [Colletotrichum paranaense]|uniref:Uncharacterized protein n=1 Tax=Colletotrichum paranaense TaxID=1914294 RepID=A0ABQ9SC92_9PEZI|nr:uncharacterized protein CPAR01_11673 [Colletotrichum paranaense]KAK1532024.1 hypothetical protein CPAR01_11673 [Colletotrichum paranaense]